MMTRHPSSTVGTWKAALLSLFVCACGQSDPAIHTAVDSQLAVDGATATLQLDISVTGGVVRLVGEVPGRPQQRRAVELARGVRGVKDVIDEMYLSDAAIVDAIRKTLASDPLLATVPIHVDSAGGNVSLTSDQTTREHRTRAVEIASKVDGVRHVEDRMR